MRQWRINTEFTAEDAESAEKRGKEDVNHHDTMHILRDEMGPHPAGSDYWTSVLDWARKLDFGFKI